MKFFIITVDSSTTPFQRDAVTQFFKVRAQFGFWHWTSEFWIINTTNDFITSVWIRDELKKVTAEMSFAVFGVDPRNEDWAMYSNPQWWEWIQTHWHK